MRQAIQLGISSWSFPWAVGVNKGPQPSKKLTVFDLLDKAYELSVNRLQIADNLPLENLSDSELHELKHKAAAFQVQLEIGTKGIDYNHLKHFLDMAVYLGSPLVRTLPALFGKKAVLQEVEENVNAVLPLYASQGIQLVLENTEAFKAEEYAALVKRINHPNFGICLDLANALGIMEGPEYVMETLGPYCLNYHFKDVMVKRSETLMGFTVEGRPSGQGHLSLPWALSKLQSFGKQPSVIIELWPTFIQDIVQTVQLESDWVVQSVSYCKSLSW